MKKYKMRICLLGYQRHMHEIKKLEKYSSELFTIEDWLMIASLPSDNTGLAWGYSDRVISSILKESRIDNSNYDLCMCFIDAPIEGNFFSREIKDYDDKTVVCSFFGVEEILKSENVDFFNYIHGSIIYRIVLIAAFQSIDEHGHTHYDTRNCLFDMCGRKSDLTLKCSAPQLCPECISKIGSQAVDADFFPCLKKEFASFKKPLFHRILNFVKRRPIVSLLITIGSSVIFNLLSSLLYDWIKSFFLP